MTFIIGHRGTSRLDHLLLTLKSIAGQRNSIVECIVIEQGFEPQIEQYLPAWVRYQFTKTTSPEYLYNRSWALNAGVGLAEGEIVVLHDGDMLVPADYATEFIHQVRAGYDVVNLKRFIAYLDETSTRQVFQTQQLTGSLRSEQMIANLCAGGSLGVTKEAFFTVGGMDEEFVGWGGEDTEFWDRCQTLRIANHCYMPMIHLWHPAQPGKAEVNGLGRSTADLFHRKMALSTSRRIQLLREKMTDSAFLRDASEAVIKEQS